MVVGHPYSIYLEGTVCIAARDEDRRTDGSDFGVGGLQRLPCGGCCLFRSVCLQEG